jgi:DNA-binding response OmpR family regulator
MAKVLVIEDQESVVAIIRYHFENEGFQGMFAGDVDAGWQKLVAEQPDAAVVDIKLPGSDGWTFIERVRADGRFSTLPVVVLTGLLEPEVVERAARLGCEYLGKPFAASTLMTKIRKLLEEDSVEAARRALQGRAARVDMAPYEVFMLTDAYRISGTIYLPPELGRFSDGLEGLMRDNRAFVPVTDATVMTPDGTTVVAATPFLEVRKAEIQAIFETKKE